MIFTILYVNNRSTPKNIKFTKTVTKQENMTSYYIEWHHVWKSFSVKTQTQWTYLRNMLMTGIMSFDMNFFEKYTGMATPLSDTKFIFLYIAVLGLGQVSFCTLSLLFYQAQIMYLKYHMATPYFKTLQWIKHSPNQVQISSFQGFMLDFSP